MANWKIAVIVLFGLLLVTLGLFTEMGLNIGGLGGKIGDALSRTSPFSFLEAEETGNITVEGSFYVSEFDLKTIGLDRVSVGYEPGYQNSEILLAENVLTTEEYTSVEIEDYRGVFLINESKVTLAGDAEEITVNGVKLGTVKKMIPVKMDSVFFRNVYVKELYMNRIELEDVVGEIKIHDKITVNLGSEPVKLESFSGSVNVTDGKFEIKGTLKRVFVSGHDYTATIS